MTDVQLNAPAVGARETPLDECWNTIGVRGDGSCSRLTQYVRCLNCPVFESVAARLLNRPMPADAVPALTPAPTVISVDRGEARDGSLAAVDASASESFLLFRLRDEWLALPTQVCRRVLPVKTIHSLPHSRSPAVLGVVNVQGDLRMCLSLERLIGFESEAASRPDPSKPRDQPRWISVARHEAEIVFPVDQIDGVHRFDLATFGKPPATLAPSVAGHTRAVAPWRGVTVGVLDADVLFDTMNRSLR